MGEMGESFWTYVAIGAALTIAGFVCLMVARKKDEENYIIERATPLPIGQTNPGDDVWVGGIMRCPTPLYTPYTGSSCVHFDYQLEERVRRTRTDSKGRTETYYTWETREHYSRAVDFSVTDDTGTLWVASGECRFDTVHIGTFHVGKWRHTERALPYPGTSNVVGTVVEGREWLRAQDTVPLIATYRSREEYLESGESSERWTRRGGYALLMLGLGTLAWMFGMMITPGQVYGSLGLALVVELGIAGMWGFNTYNQLVSYRTRAEAAWKQIDVDLKARYDIVPNLVEVVKASATHERDVFERITQARSSIIAASSVRGIEAGHEQLTAGLKSLFSIAESYPELKSSGNFGNLQEQLTAIETKIAHGRGFYNGHASEYNTLVQMFPHTLIASMFGFAARELFSATDDEQHAPMISLDDDNSAGDGKATTEEETLQDEG